MTDIQNIASDYIKTWNEEDAGRRLVELEKGWGSAATYVDPLGSAAGLEQINALIGAVRKQFPGHVFIARGTPDGHGPYVRFSWDLAVAGSKPVAGGTDVATLDGEGRIVSIIGFLDGVAA